MFWLTNGIEFILNYRAEQQSKHVYAAAIESMQTQRRNNLQSI